MYDILSTSLYSLRRARRMNLNMLKDAWSVDAVASPSGIANMYARKLVATALSPVQKAFFALSLAHLQQTAFMFDLVSA